MAEIEKDVKELLIDATLQSEIEKLAAEGWMIDPENPPKAVYHVYRPVGGTQGEMQVRLQIDDSKIGILRDGKIVE